MMNELHVENLILHGAINGNILPLTSTCNMRCVFCSHNQNPAGVQVCRIRPRTRAEVERIISYMDRDNPVVIGESVTRVIEGEPFTHPEIEEILQLLRNRFAGTTIQITTNGSLLDERRIKQLSLLKNVTLNVSLNSATEAGRTLLMKDGQAGRSIKCPNLLKEYGIPFHGSIVAMPHLVGWKDLRETIIYLDACGAQTIRVFLPGYSRLAPPALRFSPSLLDELRLFLACLRNETTSPLICEPPEIQDLKPRIVGVITGTPAERAGLRTGDLLVSVNGISTTTRVQAFKSVSKAVMPVIDLIRGDKRFNVQLEKESGERSGLVMDYDIDPALIWELDRLLRSRRAAKALLLTSEFAGPVIKLALQQFYQGVAESQVLVVPNKFFGGSIKAAGLLTVEDFIAAVVNFFCEFPEYRPDVVFLPGLAFDHQGRDLTGRSYMELGEEFSLAVEAL